MTVAELKTLLNNYPDDAVVIQHDPYRPASRSKLGMVEDDFSLTEVASHPNGWYHILDDNQLGPRQQALLIS